MGKYGALMFYHLFLVFILTVSFSCKASDEDRKVYIVYMGALPDDLYSPATNHLNILQSVLEGSSVENSLVRSYKRSFNGFAAKLTDKERLKLASSKDVVSIFPSKIYQTQTTRSWDFLGFPETISRNPTIESDTIIGVIDTGIWPESESFSDEGFGPPPKKWKGACKGGKNFTCNNKLIGARYYSFSSDQSARDSVGHGSHTASIAAGNSVTDASFYGLAKGTARGGVPSARIAAYKVCYPFRCNAQNILAAFDDAIADGVDIITISIATSSFMPDRFEYDPISIGAFYASEKGILTLNSAGNNGPAVGTMLSSAPWLMSVAASSTDRQIIDKVVLGNGKTIIGNSVNSFSLNKKTFPLVHGKDASSSRCSDTNAGCDDGCLDSGLVEGKVVLCDSFSGIEEAFKAGALGCIAKKEEFNDVSSVVPFSASALNQADYTLVLSYLNTTEDPQATILRSEVVKDSSAPNVASFSSRGPNLITPYILKPDITAPGLNILAAYSPVSSPSGCPGDKRRVKYNFESGTSMACPHVAGAAAYVKTFHPDWSPSAIKSSLMTTALLMDNTRNSNKEFDYGSGHINPIQALNPGLVYEASVVDYVKFLCSIGYDEEKVRHISGDDSSCPEGSDKGSPEELNYPSMIYKVPSSKSFSVEFHRRVKNVGEANSIYKARIYSTSLISIKVVPEVLSFKSLNEDVCEANSIYKSRIYSTSLISIKVVPEVLSFKALNEEKSFDVIVEGSGLSNNSIVSTSLVWSDGTHNVRSPIVFHNIESPFI